MNKTQEGIKARIRIEKRAKRMELLKEEVKDEWEDLNKEMEDLRNDFEERIGKTDLHLHYVVLRTAEVASKAVKLLTKISKEVPKIWSVGTEYTRRVQFGDNREFKYWSSKVIGEGDKSLAKDASIEEWKKIIVLKPRGNLKTIFSMGFATLFGDTVVMTPIRRVEEGAFGMRMGPEDCDFFIVSNEGEVELNFINYTNIKDPRVPVY